MSDLEELFEDIEEPEEINKDTILSREEHEDSFQVKICKNNHANISFPAFLIDNSFNILWVNKAFEDLFWGTETLQNIHLSTYFYNLKDVKMLKDLYEKLNSPATGFSWKGRVQTKNKQRRSDVANLLIFPIDFTDETVPYTYLALLDMVTDEYRQMLHNMFSSLLEASKLKDNDTGHHIERVNRYSSFIARYLKDVKNRQEIDEDFLDDIGFLAAMHDVGKIGTPDDILNKAGSLEPWEREVMNEHTKNGAYILSTYPNPMARQIALHHHEKWDGSGYPFGMANQMIPISARIVALADVYDALRMKRSYKEAFSHEKTKEIIKSLSGNHFDPEIVDCFLKNDIEFDKIYISLTDK